MNSPRGAKGRTSKQPTKRFMRKNIFTTCQPVWVWQSHLTGCASKAHKSSALQDAFKDEFLIGAA
jgi:hypothetical protein